METPADFNVFTEPVVKIVASTVYHDHVVNDFLKERGIEYTTDAYYDADANSELAGRLCYLSFNKERRRVVGEGQNQAYLDHIRSVGHGSVTEHSSWSFLISDVSRNLTHELVRHRVGTAFSQLSTRYVDQFSTKYFGGQGDTIGVYVPPEVQAMRHVYESWLQTWESVFRAYHLTYNTLRAQGLDEKHARSIAREILPGGAGTMILFTVNARELNHIFALRGSVHADDQIRRMTLAIFKQVRLHNLFKHWQIGVHRTKGEYLFIPELDKLAQVAASLPEPEPCERRHAVPVNDPAFGSDVDSDGTLAKAA